MQAEITLMFVYSGTGRAVPGSAEKHILLDEVISLNQALALSVNMAQLRASLNGENVLLHTVRASEIGARRKTRRMFSTGIKGNGDAYFGGGGMLGLKSDLPDTSLQVQWFDVDGSTGSVYLAGLPDSLHRTDPPGPDYVNTPGFLGKFQAWKREMETGSWGTRMRSFQPQKPILTWFNEAAAPFRLIFSCALADLNVDVGTVIQIRGTTVSSKGLPNPLGQWPIGGKAISGANVSYTLVGSQGFSASDIVRQGTVEQIAYTINAYEEVVAVGSARRKRGVGPVRRRGRSSPRRKRLV